MYIFKKSKKVNFLGYHEPSRCDEVLTINSRIRNLAHSKYMISDVAAKGSCASRAMWYERVFCWMGGRAALHSVGYIQSGPERVSLDTVKYIRRKKTALFGNCQFKH